jgi:hypothetical protein
LKVAWGKPVIIPDKPFFELNPNGVLNGLPFNAQVSMVKEVNSKLCPIRYFGPEITLVPSWYSQSSCESRV